MGPLLILLAAVTWGTTGATMKLIDAGGPPCHRSWWASSASPSPPRSCASPRGGSAGPIRVADRGERVRLLVAGLAMGAFQVFYFAGVAKTSVAVGSLVAICSAPIFITILAAALLGERIDVRTWAALCAGIAGAAFLTVGPHGLGRLPPGFVGGVLLALGGGVSYATYAVMVKDVVRRVAPLTVAALTFSIAALSLLPVLFVERPPGRRARMGAPRLSRGRADGRRVHPLRPRAPDDLGGRLRGADPGRAPHGDAPRRPVLR